MRWLIWAAILFVVYKLVTASNAKKAAPAKMQDGAKRVPATRGRPPHEVLGVAADAPPSEVRRAYQELIRQYHPDRLGHAAPELRDLAEKRTKEINAAYAAMKEG